jgi:hypothetical protein
VEWVYNPIGNNFDEYHPKKNNINEPKLIIIAPHVD